MNGGEETGDGDEAGIIEEVPAVLMNDEAGIIEEVPAVLMDDVSGIIEEVPAVDGDGVADMGVTNHEGFRTGTVRPLVGLSISCGSDNSKGALSLWGGGDLGSGAEPLLLLRGMGEGFHEGS